MNISRLIKRLTQRKIDIHIDWVKVDDNTIEHISSVTLLSGDSMIIEDDLTKTSGHSVAIIKRHGNKLFIRLHANRMPNVSSDSPTSPHTS